MSSPRWPSSLAWALLLAACSSTSSKGGEGGAASSAVGSDASGSSVVSVGSGAGSGSGSGSSGSTSCQSLPDYANDNGSVTFYTLDSSSPAVNCSFEVLGTNPDRVAHVATGDGEWFGAMDATDYANAAACGACVEITRDGTRTVTVTIVDQCPGCQAGHIDLSEQAFLQIGAMSEGYLGTKNGGGVGLISWRYVPCPVTGDVTYQLKDPTNQYWNEFLVQDHRLAITKLEVEVAGSWVEADRQSYNYWLANNGSVGAAPFAIRVTDIDGDVIAASLPLAAGDLPSSQQFPSCE